MLKISYGECPRKLSAGCRLLPAQQFVIVSVLGVTRHRLALLPCVSSRGQGSRGNRGYILVLVFAPRPRGAQRTRAFRWWSYRGRTVGLGNRERQHLPSKWKRTIRVLVSNGSFSTIAVPMPVPPAMVNTVRSGPVALGTGLADTLPFELPCTFLFPAPVPPPRFGRLLPSTISILSALPASSALPGPSIPRKSGLTTRAG